MTTKGSTGPKGGGDGATPVADLSYSEASGELDGIIEEFEAGVIDVDRLVERLERATSIVDELDRRLRRTSMQVEELVPRLEAIGRENVDLGGPDLEDDELLVEDATGEAAGDAGGDGNPPGLF
jgi:exonuclease VII small subunit